jgi:hypothetical protein
MEAPPGQSRTDMSSDANSSGDIEPSFKRQVVIAFLRSVLDQSDPEIGEASAHLIRMTIQSLEQEETEIVFVDREDEGQS